MDVFTFKLFFFFFIITVFYFEGRTEIIALSGKWCGRGLRFHISEIWTLCEKMLSKQMCVKSALGSERKRHHSSREEPRAAVHLSCPLLCECSREQHTFVQTEPSRYFHLALNGRDHIFKAIML